MTAVAFHQHKTRIALRQYPVDIQLPGAAPVALPHHMVALHHPVAGIDDTYLYSVLVVLHGESTIVVQRDSIQHSLAGLFGCPHADITAGDNRVRAILGERRNALQQARTLVQTLGGIVGAFLRDSHLPKLQIGQQQGHDDGGRDAIAYDTHDQGDGFWHLAPGIDNAAALDQRHESMAQQ